MASDQRPQLVKELFQAVVDLAPAARATYLDEHCPDTDVRAEVEALLAHHDATADPLERPAAEHLPSTTSAETRFAPFERLDEFRILRKIGEGGMAVVYLAEDATLERLVALKVLPPAFTQSEERVARFREEAIAVAQLKHPGIVPVHRVGHDKGVYYIAMEFVDGVTLAGKLAEVRRLPRNDRRATTQGMSYLREQATTLALVADALEHAHKHDIIHRDVKPLNIILDGQGRPHLTDFGIARNLRHAGPTTAGLLAGTCSYMSPEQARARQTPIDSRTDIFSLGVVLYEMITLELPFVGDTVHDVLQAVVSRQPCRARAINQGITRDLETICHKALEKEPRDRYQTAAHFAADLRCFVADRPILARPPTVYRKAKVWVRDHRFHTMAAAVVVLSGAIVLLGLVAARQHRLQMAAVSISSNQEALVYVQRVDPETLLPGEVALLGSLPIKEALLPPGQYRFTAAAGAGFAEATELLERGKSILVELPIPANHEDLVEGMVLIETGSYEFGEPRQTDFRRARVIDLPGFWIDRTEVSNADYLAFVETTGHPRPGLWDRFGYDAALAARPVVGITLDDAKAFARWKGKRLPTVYEWECAMRAPDGRRLPWGEAEPALPTVTIVEVARLQTAEWDLAHAEYVAHALDVAGDPHLASPLGLLHAASNVREMTESTAPEQGGAIIVKGASWIDPPRYFDLSHNWSRPAASVSLITGFRCARSARFNGGDRP